MSFGVVYSTQLARIRVNITTPASLFTVPAGFVAVVRDIETVVLSGTASKLFLRTNPLSLPFTTLPVGVLLSARWEGFLVMTAGQDMDIQTVGGGNADTSILISGYLLTSG